MERDRFNRVDITDNTPELHPERDQVDKAAKIMYEIALNIGAPVVFSSVAGSKGQTLAACLAILQTGPDDDGPAKLEEFVHNYMKQRNESARGEHNATPASTTPEH